MNVKLEKKIIQVLNNVKAIGATTRQIASILDIDHRNVERIVKELNKKGKVIKVGRNLWILAKYKDFSKIPNFITPEYYRHEFEKITGLSFSAYPHGREIMASENYNERIHRWFFCVQGFSATFVNDILNRFNISEGDTILDPFAGSGTVLVCAKLKNINSIGVELLPIFSFACKVKTSWDVNVKAFIRAAEQLKKKVITGNVKQAKIPFLKETRRHFSEPVLRALLSIKGGISEISDERVRELLQLALASILVPCSNLKRSPCLGYTKKPNNLNERDVINRFMEKVYQIVDDLNFVKQYGYGNNAFAKVIPKDSRTVRYEEDSIKLAITSPPYINGLDYVINYKIEMAWLDLVHSYKELSEIKAKMVACDNIPRRVIAKFKTKEHKYYDEWLERIIGQVENSIKQKVNYRRDDMHLIVRKYFEDLYPVFINIYDGLVKDGRFVIVIGDSLIAGVYIPTDLILARMGQRVGFSIESIEIARERRSGQRHDFKLRESIITLKKGKVRTPRGISLLHYLEKS